MGLRSINVLADVLPKREAPKKHLDSILFGYKPEASFNSFFSTVLYCKKSVKVGFRPEGIRLFSKDL